MGHTFSVDTSIPPGGVLLYIQKMECGAKPRFEEPKPSFLSTIPESSWQTFHSKVSTAASNMWSECYMLMGLFAFPLVAVGIGLRSVLKDLWVIAHLACIFIFVALIVVPRFYLTSQNQNQDRAIEQACSEFAHATGLTVQYRTQFTGFCKPKGAQPYRAIAIGPSGLALGVTPGSQFLSVQVPQGAGPGTTLKVQGPSGQQVQAVVPEGVSPGQVFQVQVPSSAPVVVAGTVVEP